LTPESIVVAAGNRETGDSVEVSPVPDQERRLPRRLLIGTTIGLVAIVALSLGFLDSDGDGDDGAAGTTTTPVATTAAPTVAADASTTAPTASTADTSTTAPPATTTTTTTLPRIAAEGDPVPLEDLTLGAFALGPFAFEADAEYLGRLIASLGQPDAIVEALPEHGLCSDEQGTAYTWGALTTIFRTDGEREILVGYRLDETGTEHPTRSITTQSGLELGHTLERLDAIYLQSGLAVETISGTPYFLLLRSTDDATLLWGPVSSTEQSGVVEGIYSPRACDAGPQPTT